MKTIKLIRHGESDADSEGRWQGSLDSGLSVRGLDQVRRLRERFPNGIHGRVIASDLSRSIETAAVLTVDLVPDAAWREYDIGALPPVVVRPCQTSIAASHQLSMFWSPQ